jgi:N-acetylglutamate synthase
MTDGGTGLAISVRDLEAVAALGWRAADQAPLGDWLLRAAGGFTGRANSALAIGDPGLPLPEAVAEVCRWYRARQLPPMIAVPYPLAGPEDSEVDAYLAAQGWQLRSGGATVMTAPPTAMAVQPGVGRASEPSAGPAQARTGYARPGSVRASQVSPGQEHAGQEHSGQEHAGKAGVARPGLCQAGAGQPGSGQARMDAGTAPAKTQAQPMPAARPGVPQAVHVQEAAQVQVTISPEPDAPWLARYHYRGQDPGSLPTGHVRALLVSAPWQAFAAVRDEGQVLAIGRVAIAGGWAGITAVEVDPAHRRRGLAAAVTTALVAAAVSRGAVGLYLQVENGNQAARALYRRAGFTDHHRYHYRIAPGETVP